MAARSKARKRALDVLYASELRGESATDALIAAIAPLGAHLKALGVAGDEAARAALARRLPAPLRPRVCAVGAMQTPPLDCIMDGALPWDGLLGYVGLT